MVKEKFLVNARKKIDKIDNDLIILLKKRFVIAKKIGRYKRKSKMKIHDKKREQEIVRKMIKKSRLSPKLIKNLYSLIFNESRKMQK